MTGEDCGCESMNVSASTTSVSCSDWISNGQSCFFEARTISQDCGFPSALVDQTISLNGKFVLLRTCTLVYIILNPHVVPQTPSTLLVLPVYIRNGSALHIDVQVTAVVSNNIFHVFLCNKDNHFRMNPVSVLISRMLSTTQ